MNMYIEKRKNGTFYLKKSVYNPKTKMPQNTSIYLGSNAVQAKDKLKSLTNDVTLLEQIPDILPYEVEIEKTIKSLQKLNDLQTEGVTRLINNYLTDLLNAKQFIVIAREGTVVPTADCPDCRFKNANYCDHFEHRFLAGTGRYKDGKPIHCLAYEFGKIKSPMGSIKLPRDFRTN
jgi:hypothetical protein